MRVYVQLLDTIVKKVVILQAARFDGPLASIIRNVQPYLDSIVLAIIDFSPECAGAIDDKKMLDASFSKALSAYPA